MLQTQVDVCMLTMFVVNCHSISSLYGYPRPRSQHQISTSMFVSLSWRTFISLFGFLLHCIRFCTTLSLVSANRVAPNTSYRTPAGRFALSLVSLQKLLIKFGKINGEKSFQFGPHNAKIWTYCKISELVVSFSMWPPRKRPEFPSFEISAHSLQSVCQLY